MIKLLFVIILTAFAAFSQVEQNEASTTDLGDFRFSVPVLVLPSINSRPGVMRVFSADTFGKSSFSFAYHGQYHEDINVPFEGDNKYYKEHIGINFGVTNYFDIFLEKATTLNVNDMYRSNRCANNFGYGGCSDSEINLSLGDLTFGGKLIFPLSKNFKLGVEGSILTYTDIEGTNPFHGTSFGLKGLATVNLGQELFTYGNPLLLHFNYQYFYNNSYDVIKESGITDYRALGISRYDRMNYGIGLELQAGVVNPFIEWNLSQPLASNIDFAEYPNIITFGTKINPDKERRLSLNLAVDLGLTTEDPYDIERTPRYMFSFGLAYVLGGQRKVSKYGTRVANISNDEKQTQNSEVDKIAILKEELREELKDEFIKISDEKDMQARVKEAQILEQKSNENNEDVSKDAPINEETKPNVKEEVKENVSINQSVQSANQPQIYFVSIPSGSGQATIQNIEEKKSGGQEIPSAKEAKIEVAKDNSNDNNENNQDEVIEEIKTITRRKIIKRADPEVLEKKSSPEESNVLKTEPLSSGTIPNKLPLNTKAQNAQIKENDISEEIKEAAAILENEAKLNERKKIETKLESSTINDNENIEEDQYYDDDEEEYI